MAAINIYIKDGYTTKSGEVPVYAQFYISREKIDLPCKISVPVNAWDKDKRKVSTRAKNHADLHLYSNRNELQTTEDATRGHAPLLLPFANQFCLGIIIESVRKRINDILVEFRLRNRTLTKDIF